MNSVEISKGSSASSGRFGRSVLMAVFFEKGIKAGKEGGARLDRCPLCILLGCAVQIFSCPIDASQSLCPARAGHNRKAASGAEHAHLARVASRRTCDGKLRSRFIRISRARLGRLSLDRRNCQRIHAAAWTNHVCAMSSCDAGCLHTLTRRNINVLQ